MVKFAGEEDHVNKYRWCCGHDSVARPLQGRATNNHPHIQPPQHHHIIDLLLHVMSLHKFISCPPCWSREDKLVSDRLVSYSACFLKMAVTVQKTV